MAELSPAIPCRGVVVLIVQPARDAGVDDLSGQVGLRAGAVGPLEAPALGNETERGADRLDALERLVEGGSRHHREFEAIGDVPEHISAKERQIDAARALVRLMGVARAIEAGAGQVGDAGALHQGVPVREGVEGGEGDEVVRVDRGRAVQLRQRAPRGARVVGVVA